MNAITERLPRARAAILDVGIGTGNLAGRLVELGHDVWGTDFSTEMLKRTRAKLPTVRLVRADLSRSWPDSLRERKFDHIVSAYVLHEFDLARKVKLIRKWAAHNLTSRGSIIIGDAAFRTVAARKRARSRWAEYWDEEEHYWAADEAADALEEAGLTVVYSQVSSCGGVFVVRAGDQRGGMKA